MLSALPKWEQLMRKNDFVYLDFRWREEGWYEAMRLRLAGWLPKNLADQGVVKGVLRTVNELGGMQIALTAQGMALTEPGPHSFTIENYRQLTQVLKSQAADYDWKQAPTENAIQYSDTFLNAAYRNSLLLLLRPIDSP